MAVREPAAPAGDAVRFVAVPLLLLAAPALAQDGLAASGGGAMGDFSLALSVGPYSPDMDEARYLAI